MNRISNRIKFLMVTGLLGGYGVVVPTAAMADQDVCDASGVAHEPQNVVLFMLDDVSWGEFPPLNLPIRWPNDNDPLPPTDAYMDLLDEAHTRRPDLNRLAARMFASSTNSDCGVAQGSGDPAVSAAEPCLGAADGAPVVPVDSDAAAGIFRYSTSDNDPAHHILEGHGGLARLVRNGVAFSRYYSTSGKCAPSRSSVMTGRYPVQVGVPDNGAQLEPEEITVADYLKTLCNDSAAAGTPCYTTGYIGKWHLGERRNTHGEFKALWTRGFDQALYYPGKARKHESSTDLQCAPPPQPYYCTTTALENQGCEYDVFCDGSSACDSERGPCVCGIGSKGGGRFCYHSNPVSCDPTQEAPCGTTGKCVAWGSYIGPQDREVCHPGDVSNPRCCAAGSSTVAKRADHFDMKMLSADGSKYWKKDSRNNSFCDDNSTSTLDEDNDHACMYDTRYYRDAAKNFILRNAPDTGDDSKRFFLYFAPHALHKASYAPSRTRDHYKTKNLRPTNPPDAMHFWGALEEVDAAVGQILEVIHGYCDGDQLQLGAKYGAPCSDSESETVCENAGGQCNTALRDNTVVLFTSDQGRPSSGYGQPVLRDGKGSLYEGGIRTGLLAWGPGLGIKPPNVVPANPSRIVSNQIGSHVDLFATIAHAAGCAPNADGRYEVQVCDDYTRRFCTENTEDEDCPISQNCEPRLIAGRTLLPALSPDVALAEPELGTRPFAFAQYGGAGKAVLAREGELAARVCGGMTDAEPVDATDPAGDAIARERVWGSCAVCTEDADCTFSEAGACRVPGMFCVPSLDQGDCRDGGAGCYPLQYARSSDGACGQGLAMEVKVPCGTCSTTSAWKLKGGEGETPIPLVELFDLVTNPEEQGNDPREQGNELNCLVADPEVEPTDENSLLYVQDQLRRRLNGWWDCVSNGSETEDCDAKVDPFSGN